MPIGSDQVIRFPFKRAFQEFVVVWILFNHENFLSWLDSRGVHKKTSYPLLKLSLGFYVFQNQLYFLMKSGREN